MDKADKYAVIGNPVAHSKSPFIHAEFAKQTGENIEYTAIESPVDAFARTIKQFYADGGRGVNVTLPFKQQAWKLVNHRDALAEVAGAVNVIVFKQNGYMEGYNTDGLALVRDITKNCNKSIQDHRVLLLGAGGAVRGAIEPLLNEQPHEIVIANRTMTKGVELASTFKSTGLISAKSFNDLADEQFDIIINGTSASIQGKTLPLPNDIFAPDCLCYDMMYSDDPTPFLRWAMEQGVSHCVDGTGMLVEQAAESFYIWRGIRPETKTIIDRLKKHAKSII